MPNFKNKRGLIEKWHTLYTTGEPLLVRRQVLPSSVGSDTFRWEVPKGERWIYFGGQIKNCTISSGTVSMTLTVEDDLGTMINYIYTVATWSSLDTSALPGNVATNQYHQETGMYPIPLYEGQALKLVIGANANKSGNFLIYMNVLKFKVGDR